jgi:hypothetical protein
MAGPLGRAKSQVAACVPRWTLRGRQEAASTVPARLTCSVRTQQDIIYVAGIMPRRQDATVDVVVTRTRGTAARLGRAHRLGRRGAAARGGVASRPAAAGLGLRAHNLRPGRQHNAGRSRVARAARQDRAVRRDRGRTPMDAPDGNAIAGLLHDGFGSEMTTATGICATCGKPRRSRAGRVPAGARIYATRATVVRWAAPGQAMSRHVLTSCCGLSGCGCRGGPAAGPRAPRS